jgi:hypothetical protein
MTPELEPRSVSARLIATNQALGAEVSSKGVSGMDAGSQPTRTYLRRPLLETSALEADRLAEPLLASNIYSGKSRCLKRSGKSPTTCWIIFWGFGYLERRAA